jgi:transcription initiation factor TFIID TATA-box-binding protein
MISTGARSITQSIKQLKDSMNVMHKANFIEIVPLNPIVRNIAATLNTGNKLDLNNLAKNLAKSIFEPGQFSGLIFKMTNSCTSLIFSSGKMVIVGAKSEVELLDCAQKIHKVVENYLYN